MDNVKSRKGTGASFYFNSGEFRALARAEKGNKRMEKFLRGCVHTKSADVKIDFSVVGSDGVTDETEAFPRAVLRRS